jgi:hypothetical protein
MRRAAVTAEDLQRLVISGDNVEAGQPDELQGSARVTGTGDPL